MNFLWKSSNIEKFEMTVFQTIGGLYFLAVIQFCMYLVNMSLEVESWAKPSYFRIATNMGWTLQKKNFWVLIRTKMYSYIKLILVHCHIAKKCTGLAKYATASKLFRPDYAILSCVFPFHLLSSPDADKLCMIWSMPYEINSLESSRVSFETTFLW